MKFQFCTSSFLNSIVRVKDALGLKRDKILDHKFSGKTIVILGNGFDLDLGLATSYHQFVDSDVFKSYMQLEPNGGKVEYDNGYTRNYGLMRHIQEVRQRNNWVDLELLLVNYARKTRIETRIEYNIVNSMNVSDSNKKKMYDLLVCALSKYLKSISYDSINLDSRSSKLYKDMSECVGVEVWTFNYTNLNKLCQKLNVEQMRCNVSYVHGSLENHNIILGFHNNAEVDSSYSYMKKMENPSHQFSGYRTKLEEADNIIFFGHSLGETDKDYFQGWLNGLADGSVKRNQNIIIYTKDEESIKQINMRINDLTGNRLNDIKSRCLLLFYTSDAS